MIEKLKYSIACTQCDGQNPNYLRDAIIDDNTKTYNFEKRGILVLKLKDDYLLNELSIKLNVVNTSDIFDMTFSNGMYKYDNTIRKNIKLDSNELIIKIDDSWTFNTEYLNPIKTNDYI